MTVPCIQCQIVFEITDEDLEFYEKISPIFAGKKHLIPPPRLCPICRHQRRLAFRNERKLYTRKSDMSGKSMITIYSPDKPYKVYDQDEWWSDNWDSLEYGRDFDFTRNFAEQFRELYEEVPRVSLHTIGNENSYYSCYTLYLKNCYLLFGASYNEDCKFLHNSPKSVCSYDGVYTAPDGLQFCYNACSTVGSNLIATYFVWYCDRAYYSMDCLNCTNIFGCVGLRNKHYCIFNKQYSREEYEVLAGKIVEHMQSGHGCDGDGMRWGEFFPYNLAPCCYNETVAAEYFPLEKERALALGAMWHEEENSDGGSQIAGGATGEVLQNEVSCDIRQVGDDILEKQLLCEKSGKKYKITAPELKFYRRMKLPIPRKCPDIRHYDRLELHNAYRVFDRQCAKCGVSMKSVYGHERSEIVYCEKCYLAEVY
ncbi:hypothetical protein HY604_04065 [Candidatus Peregrinibacteria bacterium]|nr:hypothetical protein [Candidatus Peregrinibacteria bacterium]